MKILVVGSKDNEGKNDPKVISSKLQITHDVVTAFWEDLVFDIETSKVSVAVNGKDILGGVDLVLSFGWYKNGNKSVYRDVAYSFALVLQQKGIKFWNSEMLQQRSTSKLSCMVQLALEGIAIPSTRFSLSLENIVHDIKLPCVMKAVAASRGRDNFLLSSQNDVVELSKNEGTYLFQEFLPNDHDLRVICFNGKPELILRRSRVASAETHLNNTSQGGVAEWTDRDSLNPLVLTEVEKICTITGREMAGVDLIPSDSSKTGYACLEVNAIPQLTSGYDVDKKMFALVESLTKEK